MTSPYLPKVATLEQAQAWLEHETGQQWPLARLIEETGIMPWVWLDYSLGQPEIFAGRLEGFLAPMLFAGDTQRLAAGAEDVVLTMTETPDGRLVQMAGMRCTLSQVRFMADDLRENARIANKPAAATASEETPPLRATHEWKGAAQAIALEYLTKHKAQDLHPSQNDVAEHVAKEMRAAKIYGPQGKPLTAGTIQREAIQGDWWRKNG